MKYKFYWLPANVQFTRCGDGDIGSPLTSHHSPTLTVVHHHHHATPVTYTPPPPPLHYTTLPILLTNNRYCTVIAMYSTQFSTILAAVVAPCNHL